MQLTTQQLAFYRQNGYLVVPDLFEPREVEDIRQEIDRLSVAGKPGVVLEENGLIRALHGSHRESERFGHLIRNPSLLDPALQVIGEPVYVYQFKINIKPAFGGDIWPWHQDYIFWSKEDGVARDSFLNAALFVDDTTEFNGPLLFLPGSHREGMIDVDPNSEDDDWRANVSAKLKYTVPSEKMVAYEAKYGLTAPKGKAGSVLFFHPNVIHGSVSNISSSPRRLLIITYNAVTNPAKSANPRPDFLISREARPLAPLG